VQFQWIGGTGVRRYRLEVGTTPGDSRLFNRDDQRLRWRPNRGAVA
jgi:hypothetical protein